MSKLYQLPDGWEWVKLKDICTFENGDRGKNYPSKSAFVDKGIAVISAKDLNGWSIELDKLNYINDERYALIGGGKIKKDDILFCLRGSLGKCGLVNNLDKGVIASSLVILRTKKKLSNNLLLYYFNSGIVKNLIDKYNNGSAQPNLSSKNLSLFEFPLPPLEEQKRIVSKLDSLFEKIDNSISLHQKNIDEANVFMASVLNDVFGELEEKYGLDKIGNMIEILTDYHSNGAYKNLKENVELLDKEDYALMIRATDLENEDYTNNVKYITESAYNYMSKSKVFGGEIILPKIGTIGNVYFMPYLERPVSLAMNLFMLRCSDKVLNKYMFLFLKSSRGNQDILNKANGAVTKTITKDAVRSIELPLPPLQTQQKVVTYLDEISQKMDKIKQIQKEKMQSLKALKASILDKAFRGEL